MAPRRSLPSLATLLGGAFLLSTNVLAAGAVLGVDLGTEYIKAALVKPGIPLEIVLTKDSRRKETSAVALKPSKGGAKDGEYPERAYGADAMALAARFPGEVYPNLKTLLGLPLDHPIVSEYASRHPALQIESHAGRQTAAFKTNTLTANQDAWMVEELLAMELQSIQKNAELTAGDGSSVRSIVLTVPPFYTTEERRSIQLAAELANLKVLCLISDGVAVGLNYATSRQFPNINEGAKPEHHLIFDMGAGSASASIIKFQSRTVKDVGKYNKTVQEVQSLGSGWDRTLGGDALNYLIVDDMISQFIESKGAQKIGATAEAVRAHGRAIAKLTKEAERVRHVLSANQNTGASFEGLYEDVDFKYKITRADFETMAEDYSNRVATVIGDALKMAGLDVVDLDSVILHGGATRTPFIQKALEKAVGSADKLRSNVNSDEAAVFGAGFRAAELSPSFRVKEIRISDGPMYATGIKWTGSNGKAQRQRLWTAVSPIGGTPKEMTFTELADFSGSFYQQVGDEDKEVMTFATKNLTATTAALKEKYPSCVDSEISFKVSLKLSGDNGEVAIAKAHVECEADASKEGFVDGVKNLFGFGKKDDEKADDSSADSTKSSTAASAKASGSSGSSKASSKASGDKVKAGAKAEVQDEKKKELVSISVAIDLEKSGLADLSKTESAKSKDRLKAFAASDKARFQREEALNQLEAFTYKIRDLIENEDFVAKSTEAERDELSKKASETSEWLDEESFEAGLEDFKSKLKTLKDLVKPIQTRVDESEKRPKLIASLKDAMDQADKFIANVHEQIAEFEKAKSKAATESTSTTSGATEKATGDFEGLEDEDAKTDSTEPVEEPEEEKGPIEPLYTSEDVVEYEKALKSTRDWLTETEAKQVALAETAEPILLVKDLNAKREVLEKHGMDLALKGVKFFEEKTKKAAKEKKAKEAKEAKARKAAKAKAKAEKEQAEKEKAEKEATDETSEKPTDEKEAEPATHDEL
ncbi:hypothetical protein VHEMI00119 [[Torrubiella] hemipterigena]|uniref:Heat shock protein 70-like protein n=1 Tax=[Torrubiella] hemipterigena TaxID=1531966 RepID=A0A0A1SPH8_9HYPO|nr:hypothetical protein VHEMI00119 [[Torrubiella] hemipterigena]